MAALREGVVEKMELQIGMPVKAGGTIGILHRKFAELTVAQGEAPGRQRRPDGEGRRPRRKSPRRSSPATSGSTSASRAWSPPRTSPRPRASSRSPSPSTKEAEENRAIAEAELDLAEQTLDEHTIVAPFDGIVIKRMKHPGESVRANEAVVELGQSQPAWPPTPTSRWSTPIASRRARSSRSSRGSPGPAPSRCPIEKKRFRGKITFVDPEIQPVAETAVRIRAEFENPGCELRPGLTVQMTIFLTPEAAAAKPPVDRGDPDGASPVNPANDEGSKRLSGPVGRLVGCVKHAKSIAITGVRWVAPTLLETGSRVH